MSKDDKTKLKSKSKSKEKNIKLSKFSEIKKEELNTLIVEKENGILFTFINKLFNYLIYKF